MDHLFRHSFYSYVFLLVLGSIFVSCSTIHSEPDPKVYYKRDIKITVGDKVSRGTLVLPASDKYKVELESPGRLDLLTISSCHREAQKEDAGTKYEWDYVPVKGLEDQVSCPLQVNGYDKDNGKHAFGYVAFERVEKPLQATIYCNGQTSQANGVSVCQSKQGLEQKIVFESEVRVVASDACDWHLPAGKEFLFFIKNRECQYVFRETQGQKEFVLDTIGYEEILLRKN